MRTILEYLKNKKERLDIKIKELEKERDELAFEINMSEKEEIECIFAYVKSGDEKVIIFNVLDWGDMKKVDNNDKVKVYTTKKSVYYALNINDVVLFESNLGFKKHYKIVNKSQCEETGISYYTFELALLAESNIETIRGVPLKDIKVNKFD